MCPLLPKAPKARLYLLCPASTSAPSATTECIVQVHPYVTQREKKRQQLHVLSPEDDTSRTTLRAFVITVFEHYDG